LIPAGFEDRVRGNGQAGGFAATSPNVSMRSTSI
jgi:hypothetical protein